MNSIGLFMMLSPFQLLLIYVIIIIFKLYLVRKFCFEITFHPNILIEYCRQWAHIYFQFILHILSLSLSLSRHMLCKSKFEPHLISSQCRAYLCIFAGVGCRAHMTKKRLSTPPPKLPVEFFHHKVFAVQYLPLPYRSAFRYFFN